MADQPQRTPEQEHALELLRVAMSGYGAALQACEESGLGGIVALTIVAEEQGQEVPGFLKALT